MVEDQFAGRSSMTPGPVGSCSDCKPSRFECHRSAAAFDGVERILAYPSELRRVSCDESPVIGHYHVQSMRLDEQCTRRDTGFDPVGLQEDKHNPLRAGRLLEGLPDGRIEEINVIRRK